MSNLKGFLQDDGLLLIKTLSFLNHHDCRRLASTSKTFKKVFYNEHSVWRLYTLRELDFNEDEETVPMKGLDWYAASSIVASRLTDRKMYKDLRPLDEIYEWVKEIYRHPLFGNNGSKFGRKNQCGWSSDYRIRYGGLSKSDMKELEAREDVAIDGVRRLSSHLLTLLDNRIALDSF